MVKTIVLTGAEVEVPVSGGRNVIIKNNGESAIYASLTAGITPGADGVYEVQAGEVVTVEGAYCVHEINGVIDYAGSIILLGSGTVQLVTSNSVNFKPESKGGGSGTSTDITPLSMQDIDNILNF